MYPSLPRSHLVSCYPDGSVNPARASTRNLLPAFQVSLCSKVSHNWRRVLSHHQVSQCYQCFKTSLPDDSTCFMYLTKKKKKKLTFGITLIWVKFRNWIKRRKQTEWKIYKRHDTRQICSKRTTDRFVHFISKLDRKKDRMLISLLTKHINLQYMLHKARRVKTPLCRRRSSEKKM